MTNKDIPVLDYQTLTEIYWRVRLKNLNNDNKCQKVKKKESKFLKNAKTRAVEIMRNIPLHLVTKQ